MDLSSVSCKFGLTRRTVMFIIDELYFNVPNYNGQVIGSEVVAQERG